MKNTSVYAAWLASTFLACALVACDDTDDDGETRADAQMMNSADAEAPTSDAGDEPMGDAAANPMADAAVDPVADAAVDPVADAAPMPVADAGEMPPVDDCPQAALMLDVAAAPGPGVEGLSPSLTATCEGDSFVVTTNGIPPYTYEHPRIALFEEVKTWRIPRNPQLADVITYPSGPHGIERIGFAVNGLQAFTPIEGAMPAQFQFGDPVSNGLTNNCGGHSAAQNLGYHYHQLHQACLDTASTGTAEPWTNDVDDSVPSPVVGFAADGFPIYGPYECADADCATVVELQSGYQLVAGGDSVTCAYKDYEYVPVADDPTVLDECNGHVGPGGDYHYHLTATYPHQTACFRGTPDPSIVQRPGQGSPGSEDVCP